MNPTQGVRGEDESEGEKGRERMNECQIMKLWRQGRQESYQTIHSFCLYKIWFGFPQDKQRILIMEWQLLTKKKFLSFNSQGEFPFITWLILGSWTARRSNQSILKEISPGCSLEGMMLTLKLQYFGTSCEELTHWKRLWCWEGLGAGGEGDNRG